MENKSGVLWDKMRNYIWYGCPKKAAFDVFLLICYHLMNFEIMLSWLVVSRCVVLCIVFVYYHRSSHISSCLTVWTKTSWEQPCKYKKKFTIFHEIPNIWDACNENRIFINSYFVNKGNQSARAHFKFSKPLVTHIIFNIGKKGVGADTLKSWNYFSLPTAFKLAFDFESPVCHD